MDLPLEFETLFYKEHALLSGEPLDTLTCERPLATDEPWISYTPTDRVGLAFSGGGIRSATFNLGVLKALHELDVLRHVDYLSTVSGGGYIGAWWSAFRARRHQQFPIARPTGDDGKVDEQLNREPEEVRHLREFSNFLSPRIGFFKTETWYAILAVLSAVLPAILVASAVIAAAFLFLLGLDSVILADALKIPMPALNWLQPIASWLHTDVAPLLLSILTIAMYVFCEVKWHAARKAEAPRTKSRIGIFRVAMSIFIIAVICLGWPVVLKWMQRPLPPNAPLWEWSTGIWNGHAAYSFDPRLPETVQVREQSFSFSPHLFDAPILWIAVTLIMFVPRLLIMRSVAVTRSGKIVSAIDRALSRLLGAAVVMSTLAVLWLIGCWLSYTHWGTRLPAGGAVISGGVFALLRNWIGNLGPQKKGGLTDLIKPLIPQILAYIAIALWSICVAALLAGWMGKNHFSPWALFAIALGIIFLAGVFFDPAQVSMHSFYRNRLARAYLGASNKEEQSSVNNRQTEVRLADDIQLRDLSPDEAKRPIHLVCCAANDLGGDQLANLSRGCRSAVLSRFGFTIGNYCHTWENEKQREVESLGLASAITASAAAFNSNMGSVSMTLGAGVTFLCSALNLRLGLWLPHPLTKIDGAPRLFPGLLYLEEMFGLTITGLRPSQNGAPPKPVDAQTKPVKAQPKPVAKYVHLSDGGHFENLALYELVRRHCRYIIVSDCGADPQVAFDDFGNAVRRIREDFGVEIDIDLSPLKPNAGRLSKQHVAVGAILYDPRGAQKDTGVLVYLKPTLTGDEPCDISQYRTRNQDFPHETTGDQFYDEAQWESYRRLGEHAARSALRFVERERSPEKVSADTIFSGARWEWYQSPDRREEKILELTGRLTALEQQLQSDAPPTFLREMYPELGALDQAQPAAPAAQPVPQAVQPAADSTPELTAVDGAERTSKILHLLIQMIQLMEDAWISASLETHWNDPNVLGWMNTFQRWAYTPSFRLWWPILKPMYGRKFRRFMEERLSLADEDYPRTLLKIVNNKAEIPPGVAAIYWKRMQPQIARSGQTVYSFELHLTDQREKATGATQTVQAGLAFVDTITEPGMARWNTEDFFVPPSLWGAGLGAKFLDELLEVLGKENINRCEVTINPPPDEVKAPIPWMKRTDLASRQQLNDLLAFYSQAHFVLGTDGKLVRKLADAK